MADENLEITFPSIKFPIITDLHVNAFELAKRYGVPPPESTYDITTIILTNTIVNLYCHERIGHRPAAGEDVNLDIKGACFLYIIGRSICRVLAEQGNEVDLPEIYKGGGRAIFQECAEEYVTTVLDEGQSLAERLFEEALANDEINEFVLYVMSLGLLYSIEPNGGTLDSLVSLFEQIVEI